MFVLSTVTDTLRVPPSAFDRDLADVLRQEIDAKYAGRVLIDVGFCLCACHIIDTGDGLVHPLDAGATYRCTFQLLVLRPFVGEIVVGTIISSHIDGLYVSLDFFDDVFIPSKFLPTPSTFDSKARIWTWKYDEGDDAVFHLDVGYEIRFRVKSMNYTKVSANGSRGLQATTSSDQDEDAGRQRSVSVDLDASDPLPSAMQVVGAINEDGLGPIAWWPDDDAEPEEEPAPEEEEEAEA
mmetsp:Transcript_20221/g.68492  ORF Transcript_20221/g.68492 Transcript_20221/m.68492 type:complete len:238 (-) Transcript_20221:65-778(-)